MRSLRTTLRVRLGAVAALAFLALPCGTLRAEPAPRGALRAAVGMRDGPHSHVTPLVYWGGFQSKSAVYEPLVRFDAAGRLQGVLLEGWKVSPDGRTYRLTLREGIVAHDGTALDAGAVADHLLRWRGNPGNRWLGSTDRLERVEVTGPREVTVTLSSPWCFLEECTIVNPAHVVAPGAYDHEGTFRQAVGTGPYRVAEAGGTRLLLEPHDAWARGRPGLARLEMVRIPAELREADGLVAWVRSGGIDLVADGEGPVVPREALAALAADPSLQVLSGPGSGVTFLLLNASRGAFAEREARRRVASAVDRDALVAEGELGWADPATTLFRGGFAGWPQRGAAAAPAGPAPAGRTSVTLLLPGPSARWARHARLLQGQLATAGFDLTVDVPPTYAAYREKLDAGAWDLVVRSTHGEPYDPFVSLQTLFVRKPAGRTASSTPPMWEDAALLRDALEGLAALDEASRARAFAAVQRRLDEEVPVVPLFVSRRVALAAAGVRGVTVGPNGYDLGLGAATSTLPVRPALPAPGAVAAPAAGGGVAAAAEPPPAPPVAKDPKDGEILLPSQPGWTASLVLDNGAVGVWTVASMKVFDRLGCPEVVGLDDQGRCFVLTSYSGRWTPIECLKDGKWLGGLAHADLDPDVPGKELYVGGEKGRLYELVPHPEGVIEERLVLSLPGQAINILVGGDLDPSTPEPELLAFTWPDGLYVLRRGERGGRFVVAHKDENPERVRDALVLPRAPGEAPEVVVASRNGRISSLRWAGGKPTWTTIHEEAMGSGRVALAPPREGQGTVLYSCFDDGRVLRHERPAGGAWRTETIYLGPQGARGLATGRFHEDPSVESVAVFGYSGRVEMLTRAPGGAWSVETIFFDRDKGHWLAAAELDGRNATNELLAVGFGGRIVLLSRPPGFGRKELADPGRR